MTSVGAKSVNRLNSHTTTSRKGPIGQYHFQQEITFIRQSLGVKTEKGRLVDLGCGDGWVSLQLQQEGYSVLGLDINRAALVQFQQLSLEVPLVQGNCLSLPFSNGSLLCILAIHCFDHLDRVRFLQECQRVLDCDGLLFFDALNRHSYKVALKRFRRRARTRSGLDNLDKYIDVMSCDEVLTAAKSAGFETKAVSGYGWIPFTVNSSSNLVRTATRCEEILELSHFPRISPRILLALRKK